MSKASEWQALVVVASEASYAAREAQPIWAHWEPGALQVKARATSQESMEIETQQPDSKMKLGRETALLLAKWITETFE